MYNHSNGKLTLRLAMNLVKYSQPKPITGISVLTRSRHIKSESNESKPPLIVALTDILLNYCCCFFTYKID